MFITIDKDCVIPFWLLSLKKNIVQWSLAEVISSTFFLVLRFYNIRIWLLFDNVWNLVLSRLRYEIFDSYVYDWRIVFEKWMIIPFTNVFHYHDLVPKKKEKKKIDVLQY